MSRRCLILLGFLLVFLHQLRGQAGFIIQPGQKQVDIPFEYNNDFIILTIRMNGIFPLRFIFDTGAEYTILTKREITDVLHIPYERVFQVAGSDLKTPLLAYLVRGIRLEIPEKIVASNEDILVLEDDYFKFEEYAGINVDGIISANTFSKYIIKINYQKHVLSLIQRESFKVPISFESYPIEVFRNKLYLQTQIKVQPDSIAKVKLLIDSGAALPLLLFSNTHPLLRAPENAIPTNIGMGLGGYIEGYSGRVNHLDLGVFSQEAVVTSFQILDTTVNLSFINGRNGLIGNGILNRFTVIIDYYNATMWLKPNSRYKEVFTFDRSGLNFIASGDHFNHFIVHNVVPNSPAGEAGILKGDELLRMGRTPSSFLTLGIVYQKLMRKPGKKVQLVLLRDGKKIKKQIVLRDLI